MKWLYTVAVFLLISSGAYAVSPTYQVFSISELSATASTTYPDGVMLSPSSGPRLWYIPQNTCPFTDGRASDNYHCVSSSDAKYWVLNVPSGPYDPRAFGAKLNGQRCTGMLASNAGEGGRIQLTSGGCANFIGRTGDLVKVIGVTPTGYGPTLLNTSIYSVQSKTVATLNTTVSVPTCSGCVSYQIYYGADDSIPINNFINSQPMNSTFEVKMPQGAMLILGSPINFNARNIKFNGAGSMTRGSVTGNNSSDGTLVVPIFLATPSHVAAFYIPDTWGAEVNHLAILGDGLYGRSFIGIETARDISIPGASWPSTFSKFEDIAIGEIPGAGITGVSMGLAGIQADGIGAQNDRGQVSRLLVNSMVHGISFCGDKLTHPSACQAVEWKLDHVHFNRVYNPIDLSHGGGVQIDLMESLTDGNTFALSDSASLAVHGWGGEYDWHYPPMALPWRTNYVYARNQVVWGTDNSFHLVTAFGASGGTEPTWASSCPNIGDVCTDGAVSYLTIPYPTTTQFIAFGTGGNPAGHIDVSQSNYSFLINYPPYGRVFPWAASQLLGLDQIVLGSDGSFHITTIAGTSGSTEPAWSVSCQNPSDTCTDGTATLKTLPGVPVPFAGFSFDGGHLNFNADNLDIFPNPGGGPNFDLTKLDFDFRCNPCSGLLSKQIYVTPSAANTLTSTLAVERPAGYPAQIHGDVGDSYTNVFPNGAGTVTPFSRDSLGITNVYGSLNTVALSPPGLIYLFSPSSVGGNTYLYKATAISGAGETIASSEFTASNSCSIGVNGCTLRATFYKPVIGADHYKIYRTVAGGASGTEKLALTVPANYSIGNIYNFEDSTLDAALGAAPPTKNTTGRARIGGDATVGGAIRSGVASNTDLVGRLALSGGTGSFALTQVYASPPNCLCYDVTTPGNACSVSESTTALAFTGTGADTVKYICAGRD